MNHDLKENSSSTTTTSSISSRQRTEEGVMMGHKSQLNRMSRLMEGLKKNMKYISLLLLTIQNTTLVLVMRYTRSRPVETMFLASTSVVMAEILKFVTSMVLIFISECNSSFKLFLAHIYENIISQPRDCLKICVPSFIYTLQNNLLYLAVSNLEAATFQVSYQLKILTTALFSVFLLGKELSRMQWFSLVMLFAGVGIVQMQEAGDSKAAAADAKPGELTQNAMYGLLAVVVACFMSGFAGVYFEKVLKTTKQSLWIRNSQLSFLGVFIGIATVFFNDRHKVMEAGFFQGYDAWVWTVILLNSLGGLMVAVVVKYADNILKGFATSAAIILSCLVSLYVFDFELTAQFSFGAGLVVAAVYLYSKFVPVVPKPATSSSV